MCVLGIQVQQTTLIDSYCNYKFMTDISERLLHSAQKLVLPDIYPNRVCKFDLMPQSTNSSIYLIIKEMSNFFSKREKILRSILAFYRISEIEK